MTTTTVYYRLRLTLDDETLDDKVTNGNQEFEHIVKGWILILEHWWDYVSEHFIYDKGTAGFECKDKCGALCRPHIHIHFNSRIKKDTIVHSLKRHFAEYHGEKLKGNNMYCLKIDPFPENDQKFFSYPMKQGGDYFQSGFSEFEIDVFRAAGAQMYSSTCEINSKKAQHREEANTLFDRLSDYLDDRTLVLQSAATTEGTKCSIIDVVNFYMSEQKPLNPVTMKGYWALYCLNTGRMTTEQYALEFL